MSQHSDEFGTWWTDFPGSDRATWATPSPHLPDGFGPGREKTKGAVSRRAPKHRLTLIPGRRERDKRAAAAEWRRQRIAAIREPSLKSGVITVWP
jgi:hypothetical protein